MSGFSLQSIPLRTKRILLLLFAILTAFLILRDQSPLSSTSTAASSSFFSKFRSKSVPKVHLYVPINEAAAKKDNRLCKVLKSALVNGWEPTVYNWDKVGSRGQMLHAKVTSLAEILSSPAHTTHIAKDDLVFFMDAMDVWLQLPPDYLVRRFLEFDADIVIGNDKVCWPNSFKSAECLNAPKSPLPDGLFNEDLENPQQKFNNKQKPQWANSGTVVGRFEPLRDMLFKLADMLTADKYPFPYSDQSAYNILLGSGNPPFVVDYLYRMFWASSWDESSAVYLNTPYPPDSTEVEPAVSNDTPSMAELATEYGQTTSPPWKLYPSLMHHAVTGEVPVAVHLNHFSGKEHIESWWGKPWWTGEHARFKSIIRDRMLGKRVKFATAEGYRDESFASLCPDYAA